MTLAAPGVLDYTDLVVGPKGTGTPWRRGSCDPAVGLDCKGLVYVVLRRLGHDVPQHAVLGSHATHGSGSQALLQRYLEEQGQLWVEVPAAERLGDVIECRVDGHVHVGVLVDEVRQLTLHATPRYGVHVLRLDAVKGVVRVLRFRGAPA